MCRQKADQMSQKMAQLFACIRTIASFNFRLRRYLYHIKAALVPSLATHNAPFATRLVPSRAV